MTFIRKAFCTFAFLFLGATALTGCGASEQRYGTVFMNYDQTVLYYNTVKHGETAVYQGPTPTRPNNGEIKYHFSGWDLPLENIVKDTTFVAQYSTTPTTFEITWANYDGKILTKTTVDYGQMPVYTGETPVRPSTEKSNYVFTGWEPALAEATTDTTYHAVFEEKPIGEKPSHVKINISYSFFNPKTDEQIAVHQTKPSDLGFVSNSGLFQAGENVTLYASPSNGYTFVGWFFDDALLSSESSYSFRAWDEDIDLEARFKYTLYPLSVRSSNTSFGTTSIAGKWLNTSMFYTEEVEIRAQAKDSIRFIGWYDEENHLLSNNGVYKFAMPNKSLNVTGKWNKFFVDYQLNGGNVSEPLVESYSYPDDGVEVVSLPTPTKTGYLFQGWTENDKPITQIHESELRDFFVAAQWRPISYHIVFVGNGSTSGSMSAMQMTYDSSRTLTPNGFEKVGYSFIGWNTEPDGTGESYADGAEIINVTAKQGDTVTLYAMWEANDYTLTLGYVNPSEPASVIVDFVTNGANETIEPQTITKEKGLVYPPIPTKNGYAFSGWYEDQECTKLFDFSMGVNQDTTLYAGWVGMRNDYYGSYNINMLNYNSSSSALSVTNLPYGDSDVFAYYYFPAFNNEKITLYYRNSLNYYSSIYGEIIDASTDEIVVSQFYTATTSYSSVSFDAEEGHVYYLRLRQEANYSMSFYFYFLGVTARLDGGKLAPIAYETNVVKFDEAYSLPSYSIAGCTFVGWFDEDGKQYADQSGHPLTVWNTPKDTTLYTRWDYQEFQITYELDGGTNAEINPTKYTIKDKIILEDPEKEGFSFEGWYLDSGFQEAITEIKGEDQVKDLTLYAKWKPNEYVVTLKVNEIVFGKSFTVSFVTNGANETIEPQTITKEKGLVYPPIPTKNGYAFSGWYEDQGCTKLFDFASEVSKDMTLYAGWVSMATSYYARNNIDMLNYSSSTTALSTSYLSTSSNYSYYYFPAFNSETVTLHYKGSSTSSYYRVYCSVIDATTNSTVVSNFYTSSTSYSTVSFNAVEGHVYYLRLYKYNANYSPIFSFYFTGATARAADGRSSEPTPTNIYKVEEVVFLDNYAFLHDFALDGYNFIGWFDEDGKQYTNQNGEGLDKWKTPSDITLYARWEAIQK